MTTFNVKKKKEELEASFTQIAENIQKIDSAVAGMQKDREAETSKLLQLQGAYAQLTEIEAEEVEKAEPKKKTK